MGEVCLTGVYMADYLLVSVLHVGFPVGFDPGDGAMSFVVRPRIWLKFV